MAKGDVVVEHANLLSFKNCSLVTDSSETYRYCATRHSWLVSDIGSFGVTIIDEGTSDKGNHLLN